MHTLNSFLYVENCKKYNFRILLYIFTEDILKYYRIFDMYIPPKMMEKTKNQNLISSTIDKIRSNLEIDKYNKEHKQIGKE